MDESNFTTFGSNISSPELPQPTWNEHSLIAGVMLTLCFLLGVPGNIAVIIRKPNWEHLSSMSQTLLMNLTISDLMCQLTLPLWISNFLHGWTFGLVACKVLSYIVYCILYGSQMTVAALSIQRYLVVVRTQQCHVQNVTLLVLLWLTSVIMCSYAVVIHHLIEKGPIIHCTPHFSSETQWIAVLVTEIFFGFVTFSLVAFSYIRLHKKVKRAAFFNNPQTSRLLITIIVSNFIMVAPIYVVNMLGVIAISLKNKELLKFCTDSWNVARSFAFTNSTLNPLLYAFISTKFCPLCTKDSPHPDEGTPPAPDFATIAEL